MSRTERPIYQYDGEGYPLQEHNSTSVKPKRREMGQRGARTLFAAAVGFSLPVAMSLAMFLHRFDSYEVNEKGERPCEMAMLGFFFAAALATTAITFAYNSLRRKL